MAKTRIFFDSEEQLKEAILKEKALGTPDIEIGEKYGVSYKYIEKIITQEKGINISSLSKPKRIKYLEPKSFKLETTSIWSFKQRGDWATHSGEYRGNYSPYIPRNIILRYSKPGELVLDIFCGAGTTAIEAKLLGRRCIASDINEKAIELARENVNFSLTSLPFPENKINYFEPILLVKDARDLSWLKNESVDLICTHPPYANIIQYTNKKEEDLSFLDIDEFLIEMKKVASECYRVLKPGRQCALLIGDTRRKRHVIPLGFKVINVFLETGFYLRELVIKRQHNCKTTGFWYNKSIENNFLLLAHEYLPIFEKPSYKAAESKVSQDHNFYFKKKKVNFKNPVKSLETTSVWIFPEKERSTLLVKNLIQRYSPNRKFIYLDISEGHLSDVKNINLNRNANYELVLIRSSIAEINKSYSNFQFNIQKVVEVARQCLKKGGYLAIEGSDIRVNGKLIPMAKIIVDNIDANELWLKEIVVVTIERPDENLNVNFIIKNNEYLEIVHSYILIYEKK